MNEEQVKAWNEMLIQALDTPEGALSKARANLLHNDQPPKTMTETEIKFNIEKKKTILVDMDNTIVNLNKGLFDALNHTDPILAHKCLHRKEFEFTGEDEKIIRPIMNAANFFLNLEPMVGAIETIKEWMKTHNVYFCTRPLMRYEHCVKEKYQWIEKHFGAEAVRYLILCKDKTMIEGHILIDDAPIISGHCTPKWKHILFSQSYNLLQIDKPRVVNWQATTLSNLFL